MKVLLLATVLLAPLFSSASPSSKFLVCTSKTYTFVVIPKLEPEVSAPYFEGAYFHGSLVSYNRTNGEPSEARSSGQTVWSDNGGFIVTVDPVIDSDKDLRRSFIIEDADGETDTFPTEKGLCIGNLGSEK